MESARNIESPDRMDMFSVDVDRFDSLAATHTVDVLMYLFD